jgi:vacuolar-type H+-ATPase subunit F/Vma7
VSFRVRGLATEPIAAGFRIAGVSTDTVSTPAEASRRLAELARQVDVGVVLMEQALVDRIPESLRRTLARRATPVIVAVPAPVPEAADAGEEYILELLRRAIGYRVKLR